MKIAALIMFSILLVAPVIVLMVLIYAIIKQILKDRENAIYKAGKQYQNKILMRKKREDSRY